MTGQFGKFLNQGPGVFTAGAGADGLAVKLDNGDDILSGHGHNQFFALSRLYGGQILFDDAKAAVFCDLNHNTASDRRQDIRPERSCDKGLLFGIDGKECTARAFSNLAGVVDEDGFIAAFLLSDHFSHDIGEQVQGFNVAAFPA